MANCYWIVLWVYVVGLWMWARTVTVHKSTYAQETGRETERATARRPSKAEKLKVKMFRPTFLIFGTGWCAYWRLLCDLSIETFIINPSKYWSSKYRWSIELITHLSVFIRVQDEKSENIYLLSKTWSSNKNGFELERRFRHVNGDL